MKQFALPIILLLALLLPATAMAYDFEVNGIYYNIDGTNAIVARSPSYDYHGEIVIPASVTYNGTTYTVTSIGENAFYDCTGLTSIVIPNSVTLIGNSAFSECSNLSDVTIPNSVTSIGECSFENCKSLTNLIIPNSVTSIGEGAFYGCSNLVNVTLSNALTSISYWMFINCTSLTSIDIPNSVTTIEWAAFSYCSSLKSITIPNSVTTIEMEAFCGCTSLENINFSNSLRYIGDAAFSNTAWYNNQPDGLVYIGVVAYRYKGEMLRPTDVIIKDGTISIAESAFSHCDKLINVIIPNSVTSIGYNAFNECTSLTRIEIGNSVTSIGYSVFYNCPAIAELYCYATTPPECQESSFSSYNGTLHVPAASLAAYFVAPYWSNFENIVGDALEPAVVSITINADSMDLQLGEQFQLTASVTPASATNDVFWNSTNTAVATVENGTVTAIGVGECDIIASCSGLQARCHVVVHNKTVVISLDLQDALLLPNHMLMLMPSATPFLPELVVTSSDPTVAAARLMNGKVQVVGIKEGTTTITVGSSDDTAVPATCLVTVYTEPGDVNCDGFVNISDITAIISFLLNNDDTSIKIENADYNGDGSANISDATALISYILSASGK
jgi:uncharacterized protein YjdB